MYFSFLSFFFFFSKNFEQKKLGNFFDENIQEDIFTTFETNFSLVSFGTYCKLFFILFYSFFFPLK